MPKRKFRIVRYVHPLTAICEYCNQTFFSDNQDLDEAEQQLKREFDTHKCNPVDSSQNALRIVREATEDK